MVAAANIDLALILGNSGRFSAALSDPADLAQRTPAEVCSGNYNTTISF